MAISKDILLPSLVNLKDNKPKLTSTDFVNRMPALRRGLYDCFGLEDEDLSIFDRRHLRTPPEVREMILKSRELKLRNENDKSISRSKGYQRNSSKEYDIPTLNINTKESGSMKRTYSNYSNPTLTGGTRTSRARRSTILKPHSSHNLKDLMTKSDETLKKKQSFFPNMTLTVELSSEKQSTNEEASTKFGGYKSGKTLFSGSHPITPSAKGFTRTPQTSKSEKANLDETNPILKNYIGIEAHLKFAKRFHTAVRDLAVYEEDNNIPRRRLTPRSLFLREQTKRGLLPLPLILRKMKDPRGIFLGSRGLGDDRMMPVFEVLESLPLVETIDVSDNRLTDKSLMTLAVKLKSLSSLTHLDLSFNKIDESSGMVLDYLRSSDCILRKLLLNGADVDDNECLNLMDAIRGNSTIATLGLSRNLIGAVESLNFNHGKLGSSTKARVGAFAIADMLSVNETLTELDLSWNAIRFTSAEALGSCISANNHLRVLNLAHNSFGDLGTQMLGRALKTNNALVELNLSYNSLSPRSATVLALAISYNKVLESVVLDGNIIGNVGAQSLVAAIQRSSVEERSLRISIDNCDCRKVDPTLFNPSIPSGIWTGDLSKPYGQMLAEECFYLANNRVGYSIVRCEVNGHRVALERRKHELAEDKMDLDSFHACCKTLSKHLLEGKIDDAVDSLFICLNQFDFWVDWRKSPQILELVRNNWCSVERDPSEQLYDVILFEIFYALFVLNDQDLSDSMDLDEFQSTLVMLGKPGVDLELLQKLMSEFDIDQSGTIDANEFSMIMVNHFCSSALPRGFLYDRSTGAPFHAPSSGTILIELAFESDLPSKFDVGQDSGVFGLVDSIRTARTEYQREILFEHIVNSPYFYFTSQQAQIVLDEMLSFNYDPLTTIADLLPQVVNSDECNRLINFNLEDEGKLELRVKLGMLYNAYVGMATGFYALDVSNEKHLRGGRKLTSISHAEAGIFHALDINTSQRGILSSFRNEYFNEDVTRVDGSWFASCPSSGSLQLDFVSMNRPRPGTKPLSVARFKRWFTKLGLDELLVEVIDSPHFLKAKGFSLANMQLDDDAPFESDCADSSRTKAFNPAAGHSDQSKIHQTFSRGKQASFVDDQISARSGHVSFRGDKVTSRNEQIASRGEMLSSRHEEGNRELLTSRGEHLSGHDGMFSSRDALTSREEHITSRGEQSSHSHAGRITTALIVEPPLTALIVREQYRLYMLSSHHYRDGIYPEENIPHFGGKTAVPVPPELSYGPKPSTSAVTQRYAIAFRKLLEIQVAVTGVYLTVEQIYQLIVHFPIDGYIRVQLLTSVFSRIVDIENLFIKIIDGVFTPSERTEVVHRLGYLNVFNPVYPDRTYKLDLRRWDHRETAKILIALAVAEPGENWLDTSFRWSRVDEPVPGWVLPASWANSTEDDDIGLRRHGWLIVTYTSTGDGCSPVITVRFDISHHPYSPS